MYHVNSQPDWPVYIGTLDHDIPAISFAGLTLAPRASVLGGKLEIVQDGGKSVKTLLDVSYSNFDKSP